MLLYNLRLAWKSVRRYPVLSALILLGIALGVGVSTTFITAYHVLARDPVPGKSDSLYYVRMNSWGVADDPFLKTPPPLITWRDAQELLKSRIPARSTATFASRLTVFPARRRQPACARASGWPPPTSSRCSPSPSATAARGAARPTPAPRRSR